MPFKRMRLRHGEGIAADLALASGLVRSAWLGLNRSGLRELVYCGPHGLLTNRYFETPQGYHSDTRSDLLHVRTTSIMLKLLFCRPRKPVLGDTADTTIRTKKSMSLKRKARRKSESLKIESVLKTAVDHIYFDCLNSFREPI